MSGRGERDLRVNFLANVRDFLTGTKDSGKALADLEGDFRSVDQTSDRAHSSMQAAARKTATSLDAAAKEGGGKFKASGREIGSEFMQNLGESIGSGQANVGDTLMGTLGGLTMLPGIGAAVAVAGGIGAMVVGAIAGRIRAEKAKLDAAVGELFTALQNAKNQAERDAAALDSALSALGGGDVGKGWQTLNTIASQTNLNALDLAKILTGQVNPATSDLDDKLTAARDAAREQLAAHQGNASELAGLVGSADKLLGLMARQPEVIKRANDVLNTQVAITDAIAGNMGAAYNYAQRLALLNAKDPLRLSSTTRTP